MLLSNAIWLFYFSYQGIPVLKLNKIKNQPQENKNGWLYKFYCFFFHI